MKKSVLSLSIAAVVAGFAGNALAVTDLDLQTALGTSMLQSVNLTGHHLIVPYFTSNGDNKTLINVINTDTVNGKAVKVRFRSATNSDDLFDFQVFLSPADVYAMEIGKDATTGISTISSSDTSCTKAVVKGAPRSFDLGRLDSTKGTAASMAAASREGYVEILTMADIKPGTSLFTAIKHVANGAPPCSGAAWTAIDTDTTTAGYLTAGLSAPTASLTGNWTIVNTTTSAVFGGAATDLAAYNGASKVAGAMIYWPQVKNIVSAAVNMTTATSDPLLSGPSASIQPVLVDLPDMSTAFTGATSGGLTVSALLQSQRVAATLARTSVTNEYLTTSSINASTDWTFTMPTRRYEVAYNYAAGTAVFAVGGTYFTATNAKADAARRMVCIQNVAPTAFDREENSVSNVAFSPVVVPVLCGEVSVYSVNNALATSTNSLLAAVTVNDIELGYSEGWLSVATPGLGLGLPVIGNAYTRANTGKLNIGVAYPHR